MRRRLAPILGLLLAATGCGRARAPEAVTLRWEGEGDLDIEIRDAAGEAFLRDAAGDSPALDAAGGRRNEESWGGELLAGETSAMVAVACWDFAGRSEIPAVVERRRGEEVRTYRATLTPERPVWKVFRWSGVQAPETPVDKMEERTFSEGDTSPPFLWGK